MTWWRVEGRGGAHRKGVKRMVRPAVARISAMIGSGDMSVNVSG